MINATKPYLPDRERFDRYMDLVWESAWLTNNGPLVRELEEKLNEYLGLKNLLLVNNGTIAIQILIRAMELAGEIITTPFSYIATTSSIVWERCRPVFADIDPETLCISPEEIERKITPRTSAIIATHVFGVPCNVEVIREIAERYGLKVIYDAAHAFGIEYNGKSLLEYGDASTLSFHATKLFHTVEGGAMVCRDEEIYRVAEYMRRFGHKGAYDIHGLGINGKNSEVHAAMGLSILPDIDLIIGRRKSICESYDDRLSGAELAKPLLPANVKYNYSYYPLIFPDSDVLDRVIGALEGENVHGRKYFNPSLNTLSYVEYEPMPLSEDIASRIFCLPLYHDLREEDIDMITSTILYHL